MIYEGMRLEIDPITGKYDLTFTASVPAMPVTFRLQLVFVEAKYKTIENPVREPNHPATVQVLDPEARKYTITLPPIRMQPPRDAEPGDPTPRTFHIAHRGYSSLFLDPKRGTSDDRTNVASCHPQGPIDCTWTVSRTGTARFGTPVAIDDPNR
ncbi:hypothetical protein R5W23_001580 [Gemmata sp. JC673]|uniref:Uncharacterized protein n=1 Tax=Gemmata algarum TaxID=2975278 RepID=A0ABU5EYF6_9BACT|nr:hypothetical protein [Gemmata algarum]MDY3560347.1 hypothetical protein [Gemmata algarum]